MYVHTHTYVRVCTGARGHARGASRRPPRHRRRLTNSQRRLGLRDPRPQISRGTLVPLQGGSRGAFPLSIEGNKTDWSRLRSNWSSGMRSARFFSSGRVTAAAADEGRAARGAGRPATAEDHVVRHFHAYDAADEAEAYHQMI